MNNFKLDFNSLPTVCQVQKEAKHFIYLPVYLYHWFSVTEVSKLNSSYIHKYMYYRHDQLHIILYFVQLKFYPFIHIFT